MTPSVHTQHQMVIHLLEQTSPFFNKHLIQFLWFVYLYVVAHNLLANIIPLVIWNLNEENTLATPLRHEYDSDRYYHPQSSQQGKLRADAQKRVFLATKSIFSYAALFIY
ncbi:hypothetical protein AVEN_228388-1 [Araneus ventricosus]|uniref:Uncharacterized protein n=1 Tax=Araneus ventricosus TaxID=182803 RepID=A0A4Y2CTR9_ARAVE|nr:hypothetical protein AVEN_228388-1 [Araneus ventricosus]